MQAIVYHGKEDFRYERTSDPKLESESDSIIRVSRTAICGSDLHLYHGGIPDGIGASGGFAVGHEFLGVIEEVGRGVRGFKKGDRVLASCTVGCGDCALCRRGVYSGCLTMTRGGGAGNVFGFSPSLPGGQAEAVRVPFSDTNLFRVPAQLSDELALFLTDIRPTGYMGAELAEVAPGDTVVVFGCGPVGTFAQMSAFLRGAARVIAVDLHDERLGVFNIAIRYPEEHRRSTEDLGALLVDVPGGYRVPLRDLAEVKMVEGPVQISRENGQRRIGIELNVAGRDIGGFVREARGRIKERVALPSGYHTTWGGQFENQQQAMRRLGVIVPVVVSVIFVLLLLTFPAIHLVVILEERELRDRFGAEYEEYCRRVPRYLPRRSLDSQALSPEP